VDYDKAGYFHHNYIHHVRRSGLGYGIGFGKSSAKIYSNIFNACRHMVSGARDNDSAATPAGNETYVKFYYNIVGYDTYESNGVLWDHHGGSDTVDGWWGPLPSMAGVWNLWAGGEIEIKYNDFKISTTTVNIRGLPRFSYTIEWNWIYYGSEANPYGSIWQRLYTIPGYSDAPPYRTNAGESISTANNWWGTYTPPS
jgi:hypothetical protein